MKKVLVLVCLFLSVAGYAHAWVVVCDPYIPAADGSVGIPTEFVCRFDGGTTDVVSQAVNPTAFPTYFTPPTGGFPAGSAAMVFDVTARKGNHTMICKARNAEGESAFSAPFSFVVPVSPATPGSLRLLK